MENKTQTPKVGLGALKVPLFKGPFACGLHYTVHGGPYKNRPANMIGVKMAVEITAPCDISIPTRDYSVPDVKAMISGVEGAIGLMVKRQPLYVGCWGGIGRTGLFLAVLVKAFGIEDPVSYVRTHYLSHAVETPEQKEYVKNFPITPKMRKLIKRARLVYGWRIWMRDLTKTPIDKPSR